MDGPTIPKLVSYICGDCGDENSLNPDDVIQSRECDYAHPVGITDGTQFSYYEHNASAYMEGSGLTNPLEGLIYYESGSNTIPESAGISNPETSTYPEHIGSITYVGNSGINTDTNQVSTEGVTDVAGASSGAMSTGEVSPMRTKAMSQAGEKNPVDSIQFDQ
jgi:hypothetical protein